MLYGRSNAYLVRSNGKNILIDTSVTGDYSTLIERMTTALLAEVRIDFLILTHTHYDHCQNAAQIQREYNAPIAMSEYEAGFAQKGDTPLPNGTWLITKLFSCIGNRIGRKGLDYQSFTPDKLVKDDAVRLSEISPSLQLLPTPGHTKGSISVIVDDEVAIVGDALFGIFRRSIFPPFANDVPLMLKSWEKLLSQTNCNVFLPGHGRAVTRQLLEKELRKRRKG